jgi:hypothetical protein
MKTQRTKIYVAVIALVVATCGYAGVLAWNDHRQDKPLIQPVGGEPLATVASGER